MADLQKLFAELDRVWAEKRPDVAKALRPGATAAKLQKFKKAFDAPEDVLALYKWHDGAKDEHLPIENLFGWCSLDVATSEKKRLDGLEDDGTFGDWPSGVWWNPGWIPIFQFNLEDHICVDVPGVLKKGDGAVFIRRNADDRRTVLAPSLAGFLEVHLEITKAGPTKGDEDAWLDHFDSEKVKAIREKVGRGFPATVTATKKK
ncbi:SMI1/KNR4 family protein [Pendulispora brunnea]|uniref:SMI1/KNR4 family protein n=1 Tax=Pendulispora brunnea TaxID=2905690 RepID=A0ABZ2K7F9_9BACT